MNSKYFKGARILLAVIVSLSLLTGCKAAGEAKQGKKDSSSGYEQYDADGSAAQTRFDALTQSLFKEEITESGISLHFSLADPASRGIQEFPCTFGDFSLETMKKNFDRLREIKKELEEVPIQKLSEEQKLTYKILAEFLETELLPEGLELYAQPLTSTIGIQAQLPILLAEYAFYNGQDAENYLNLLSTIDTYYAQIIEFEKQKSAAGLFMCDASADHVLKSCEAFLVQADHSFMSDTFNERIDALSDLSDEEKAEYKARNITVLQEHFIPAYKALIDGITALMGTGENESGMSNFPQGKEYFEYLVKSNICTSYHTIPALHKAIEKQLNSDLNTLGELAQARPELVESLDSYSFRHTEPEDILNSLKELITADFPQLPDCSYKVKQVPKALEDSLSPAFYLTPAIDHYQDNVIYINGSPNYQGTDLFTTLAHEGYPGHLYQNVYFIGHNTCDLRDIMSFSSYSEGWASYVENYSYTLDNGLAPGMGELLAYNNSVSLGLYALLDICINYDGWDKEQVAEYLSNFYDVSGTDVVDSIYYSLVETPTNYMEYYVGYMEITQMKETAKKILKERFDLKQFHTFLLDIGPSQFSIIRPYFRQWLAEQMA